jgi:hypothetical protein
MSKHLLPALVLLGGLACHRVAPWHHPDLRDNVFVSYSLGCERGCERIERGDLLLAIDGRTVRTVEDVDAARLTDGRPHRLEVRKRGTKDAEVVEVVARPRNDMPPLADVGPFWLVSSAALHQAPDWARRRMFAHASPMVQLVSIDGGILDGRQLYGRRRLMVYWDWGDRVEEAHAVAFMQVLQKAQADLSAAGVDVMFVHTSFPRSRKRPMNDGDLRRWADKWSVEVAGEKLPAIPFYRRPNETEHNAARELGMENAFTVMENLGQSPTIVVLDERGIVRWHSEGVETPPQDADVQKADQYTIIEAIEFALEKL